MSYLGQNRSKDDLERKFMVWCFLFSIVLFIRHIRGKPNYDYRVFSSNNPLVTLGTNYVIWANFN